MSKRRIAKNTILLYFRMLLTLGVSLYTSRVILKTLGIDDFGIFNVVGGIVAMFSFFNSAMSSATQRFLSYELGKNDCERLRKLFSMSVNIHGIIAVAIIIFSETIGLWFLNAKLNIPVERMGAANWVYQFSILSFVFTVIGVPYNAIIIAHERMNLYAYVSIVEVVLKLGVVFALAWFGCDKLRMYSVLLFCVSILLWLIYKIYCKRNFPESSYLFFWDKSLYRVMMNYAGWNLFGNIAAVAMGQGVNILLNIFFGPVVNSARGIAYQVNSAVSGFVSNFQMAMNPQIIKSYAANDRKYMHLLIFQGAKYSFFLLFFITLPIMMEAEAIIKWWLKVVPEYTIVFCRLVLINTLIDCISGPLMTAAQATGKIKKYQSIVGGVLLLNLPVSYEFLRNGYPPQITFYIGISISIIALFTRLLIIAPLVGLSIIRFTRVVIARVFLVAVLSVIFLYLVKHGAIQEVTGFSLIAKYSLNQELVQVFAVCISSILSVMIAIYCLGLSKEERVFIKNKVRNISVKSK